MDDDVGFTYFLNLSYKQHRKDYPFDEISFHDFSSICLGNWESLDDEPKAKIIELAKNEQEKEIRERKPKVERGREDNPISLESDGEECEEDKILESINVVNVINFGETLKKNFAKDYSYCKKPRSAYIYFVKAARLDLKNQIKSSKDNFIEISKAISSKWKELKVNQRKVFDDLAILDKKFNGFKSDFLKKKKQSSNHTALFLKAREARTELASSAGRTVLTLASRPSTSRGTTAARSTTRRKIKRKRSKKRKTTKKTKTSSTRTPVKREIKREIKREVKVERKFKVKREV